MYKQYFTNLYYVLFITWSASGFKLPVLFVFLMTVRFFVSEAAKEILQFVIYCIFFKNKAFFEKLNRTRSTFCDADESPSPSSSLLKPNYGR